MKTDSELQSDVADELKWWPNVDAAHIGVAAKDGVVTLTGQVAHFTEKQAAEDAAKVVYGVKGIANDITVELLGSSKRTDQDVAAAALNAMSWDFEVPNDKIKVGVKNGWVTMEGTVDWQYQKDAAARCVRYLMGVVGVSNLVAIKPGVKWIDVKTQIEDALRRNADLEARRIAVSTSNGTMTLRGSVDLCRLLVRTRRRRIGGVGRARRDNGQGRPLGHALMSDSKRTQVARKPTDPES